MAEWKKADSEVIEMANVIIKAHHKHLEKARIGFSFRSEAIRSRGRATIGKAQKVPDRMRLYVEYDFLIWLAQDYWDKGDYKFRKALIDHELCHCGYDDNGNPCMVPHDIEEFYDIVSRHGEWSADVTLVNAALNTYRQQSMNLPGLDEETEGGVFAVEPETMEAIA
jgi:hypothetical protein